MMLTKEEFIENLKGTKWQEVECKITSIDDWQFVEEYVINCFAKPSDAKLMINELLLNGLTATAGLDLDNDTKITVMQDSGFAEIIKERLASNKKYVTLKLIRNRENIDIEITDMGEPRHKLFNLLCSTCKIPLYF